MLLLSLIWLGTGLILGGLACGARLRPVAWGKRGWLAMLGIGMVAALVGGWVGMWLLGVQYGTVSALWVGVVGVWLVPGLASQDKMRTLRFQARNR